MEGLLRGRLDIPDDRDKRTARADEECCCRSERDEKSTEPHRSRFLQLGKCHEHGPKGGFMEWGADLYLRQHLEELHV